MFATAISVSRSHAGLKRRDAFFQLLVFKCLLLKLDDVLRGACLDWLFVAVQELYKGLCRPADVRLQAVQRALDDLVPLAFKLLAEGFFVEPFLDRGLVEPGAPASLFGRRGGQQKQNHPPLPLCQPPVIVHIVGFRWISSDKSTARGGSNISRPRHPLDLDLAGVLFGLRQAAAAALRLAPVIPR